MTTSVFDHGFLSGLLGDEEIAAYFTAEADLRAILAFETALAKAEAGCGVIPAEMARSVADVCAVFKPDIADLKATTAVDGVVVPGLVKQLRKAAGADTAAHIHFGATSQDAVDTSLILRLRSVTFLFVRRLARVIDRLEMLGRQFGAAPLMGHTRMQAAIPITVSNRLRAWTDPLQAYQARLTELTFPVQFGGAAGTLEKLGDQSRSVRAALAQELGLADVHQWQSQRAWIADFANILSLITGSLGKFGQDVALLALAGAEIELGGGGNSSAMPHKQNPVAAETLVSLARFNATQLAGIHQSLVHEQERSGAAWALEWMILPQMVMATAAALRLSIELSGNIKRLGQSLPLS